MIEAERFMAPRISLRANSPSSGVGNDGGVGPRSPDGKPFLFEVLGGSGGNEGGSPPRGWGQEEGDAEQPPARGMTSLENVPPPTLDPLMWTEADGKEFAVRGASYLTTRMKVPSAKQVCLLSCVVLCRNALVFCLFVRFI